MNRPLRVGETVTIRPSAVEALKCEGYIDVKAHVPSKIEDTWVNHGRRVFQLAMRLETHEYGTITVAAWANQVRLANGTAERASVATEKRVAEMVAAKAAREAARRIPRKRSKRA